jgi:RNA polymerase sigma-70 factor (ECF subfamily)
MPGGPLHPHSRPDPKPNARTDDQLVSAANAGDIAAFGVLYERHKAWVYRLALRFTGEAEAAADLTQDAFIELLRRFPGFRLSSRLTTYLYPIVRNGALAKRRKDRPLRFDASLVADAEPESLPTIAPIALSPSLTRALESLPDGQREVLLMRIVDEMTLEEISLALHIPLGTVKSRLHTAIAALQRTTSPEHIQVRKPTDEPETR